MAKWRSFSRVSVSRVPVEFLMGLGRSAWKMSLTGERK